MKETCEKQAPSAGSSQRFVVFEFYANFMRYVIISVRADGIISVDKQNQMTRSAETGGGFARDLEQFLSAKTILEDAQYILVFDTKDAVLIQQSVALTRPDWNAEITVSELENIVRHGVWKLFQRDRSLAAKLLGVNELQLRLADIDVAQLKLDGHRVISPVGFRSHVVDCLLRATFIRSEPWQEILNLLSADKIMSVTERTGFWAGYAAALVKDEALFLEIGERQTIVYSLVGGAVTYRDTVQWGSGGMFAGVVAPFGLPVTVASALIDRYAAGQCSDAVANQIERALEAEFSVLMHTIEAHRNRRGLPVFVHSVTALPALLNHDRLLKRLGVSGNYTILTDENPAGSRGLVVQYNRSVPRGGLIPSYDTALALVRRVCAGSHESLVGKTARQRARWIAAQHDVVHS